MADQSHRKEGMQRIQVGLAGLAGVVLLIGLASIVVDNIRRDDIVTDAAMNVSANVAAAVPVEDSPGEPLAELGVTPASDAASQPPVVADLQPDPNLKQPMDRAPATQGARSAPQPTGQ